SLSHTHTHSLTLSLSLSHTHTHTFYRKHFFLYSSQCRHHLSAVIAQERAPFNCFGRFYCGCGLNNRHCKCVTFIIALEEHVYEAFLSHPCGPHANYATVPRVCVCVCVSVWLCV